MYNFSIYNFNFCKGYIFLAVNLDMLLFILVSQVEFELWLYSGDQKGQESPR